MPPEVRAAAYAATPTAQRHGGGRSHALQIEPYPDDGDAVWLLSFADLVTLLLTVFVLLFAYSRVPSTTGHPSIGRSASTPRTLPPPAAPPTAAQPANVLAGARTTPHTPPAARRASTHPETGVAVAKAARLQQAHAAREAAPPTPVPAAPIHGRTGNPSPPVAQPATAQPASAPTGARTIPHTPPAAAGRASTHPATGVPITAAAQVKQAHPAPKVASPPPASAAQMPELAWSPSATATRLAPVIPPFLPGYAVRPKPARNTAPPVDRHRPAPRTHAARRTVAQPRWAQPIIVPKDLQGKVGVVRTPGSVNLIITDDLLYPAGAARLGTAGRRLLDRIAAMLQRTRYGVSVEGYTDNTPIHSARFPSNWELSTARATTVARYLIARGVDPDRLSAVGYGDTRPRASNATAAGRALNRRVVLVLHAKARQGSPSADAPPPQRRCKGCAPDFRTAEARVGARP